jgi:hypothetical protein
VVPLDRDELLDARLKLQDPALEASDLLFEDVQLLE